MKHCFLCMGAILLLFNCSGPAEPSKPTDHPALRSELDTFYLGDQLVQVEKITKAEFNKVSFENKKLNKKESFYLERDSGLVKRMEDTLFFKTEKGITRLVNNRSEGDDMSDYAYMGYDDETQQYLVQGSFYEWSNILLIDKITGDSLITCSVPVLSPDKKRFVTGNTDLQAGFNFNGLEIFENTHRPKLTGSRALGSWGPDKIKWLDNATLMIECSVIDTTKQDLVRTDYFKLKLAE